MYKHRRYVCEIIKHVIIERVIITQYIHATRSSLSTFFEFLIHILVVLAFQHVIIKLFPLVNDRG